MQQTSGNRESFRPQSHLNYWLAVQLPELPDLFVPQSTKLKIWARREGEKETDADLFLPKSGCQK